MDKADQKLQRKVARRKETVKRMIQEQRTELDSLDPGHEEYYHKRRSVQARVSRFEQELRSLETGRVLGSWG